MRVDFYTFWLIFFQIYDGLEIGDAFELVKYSGAASPRPSVSRKNAVVVVFKSNAYVTAKGFSITYNVYVPTEPPPTTEDPDNGATPLDATSM